MELATWEASDKKSVTGAPMHVVASFSARTWEEAMQQHYDVQGYGEYKPMEIKEVDSTDDRRVGIYRKYSVMRLDGSSTLGGKHEHCEYFVLDWAHDKYAPVAARAYAEACKREYPELARDLLATAQEAEKIHCSCTLCASKGTP